MQMSKLWCQVFWGTYFCLPLARMMMPAIGSHVHHVFMTLPTASSVSRNVLLFNIAGAYLKPI